MQPTVKIYHQCNEQFLSIYFKDNGIGIQETYHQKIFEMFTRLHTYVEYEGTGLGLPTCKKIAEELGGEIGLVSQINQQTTFEVKLPIGILTQKEVST